MSFIEWSGEYSVNVREIDTQHKHLFKIIEDYNENIVNKAQKEVLDKTLNDLIEYSKYHFGTEEKYMEKYNFLDDLHRGEHAVFINKVNDIKKRLDKGRLVLSVEISNFFRDWLINHVLNTDKKCSLFAKLKDS